MDWILIVSFLLTGLLLIVVEILFVPGTTLVGLAGIAFAITGIFSAYHIFGTHTGHLVLAGTLMAFAIGIYFAFRSEMWMRFANTKIMVSKVNEGMLDEIHVGLEGKTVSALRPIGKAEFLNKIYEVTSNASLVEAGKMVKIVGLKDFRIFVEPLNTSI